MDKESQDLEAMIAEMPLVSTVGELIDSFWSYASDNLSETTARLYKIDINVYFNNKNLSGERRIQDRKDLGEVLTGFVASVRELPSSWVSTSSKKRKLAAARYFIGWLVEEGYLNEKIDFTETSQALYQKKARFTYEDKEKLVNTALSHAGVIGKRDAALIEMMYSLRVSLDKVSKLRRGSISRKGGVPQNIVVDGLRYDAPEDLSSTLAKYESAVNHIIHVNLARNSNSPYFINVRDMGVAKTHLLNGIKETAKQAGMGGDFSVSSIYTGARST